MPRLNPVVSVTRRTPLTFLVHGDYDDVGGVNQSRVHHAALAKVHVLAKMHLVER